MADAIDLVEVRYGWTDDQVLTLPYARFLQVLDQAAKGQREEMRRLAFLGWQVQAPFRSQAVGFSGYLRELGLVGPGDLPPRVSKAEALAKAEAALRKMRKQRQVG